MNEFERKTINFYNDNADSFQESIKSAIMTESCNRFLSYLPKQASILDLGCGTGRDSLYFKNLGYSVLPLDASEKMCEIATSTTGIKAIKKTFEELCFKEQFDGIWACASLLHVSRGSLPQILCRINKSLTPKGILYMSFKYGNSSYEKNGRFFTDLTEDDIPLLCNENNGFEILEYYISQDVRPERSKEKWLNIIARKK